ncbi:Bug family tripartite tricarboxylate transporter substrate binding protein [Paracraurococcus lichenis]|uniref:Tripartite tricarboxylate transporter substrate binding protein n=1 Tax=Paracraurococcus lichenis TaxID=3064888 RepID=A0ABT9DVV2_9PROT|nr:tripartite tricarboxylate transporter substrate binding protein [Paracraurococcus sp. LOR1-02]MDO9708027.1 tripartite tricarboxylate transporter substrate binding protein [Paracraurococcus sp. LOR1-02]
MHRRGLLGALALSTPAITGAFAQGGAHAERWPTREIQLVTGFGPGGGTDVVARAIAAHMEKTLGVPVVVRNTPGAGGTLGPTRIAQAKPDGYTFGLVGFSALVVAPMTMDLSYRPWESFDFLGITSELRIAIPVGPSLPQVRTIADFIAEAQRRPLTFASTNPGSAVSFFDLQRLAGIQMTYVQIPSITEAASQVAGGHIDTYSGTAEMIGLVKGGNLRMLASASLDRWPEFPEVPTLIEQGYETATRQLIIWAGPAGLPPPVRERLASALMAAAADPEVIARQNVASIAPRPVPREQAMALMQEVRPGVEAALVAAGQARKRG